MSMSIFLWRVQTRALAARGLFRPAHLQFCLCSFQVVHARLLIFFPIKEHELEALNLVCPFCHPLLKQTFRDALQPTYRNYHGNRSLSVRLVYMCHAAWALIYPSAGLSASVFGDFRGCLATWIYGYGGWGGYQKPCGSWRRDSGEMESVCVCVCVNLQLIRSTSCSQAEFISTVCSFFTGIIHSHISSWSFTIWFNIRLLHSIFRLALNLQLFKAWAQWQCARGGVEMIVHLLCAQQWETGYSDRRVGGERESANSPRLSALLTDELHVAKRVCVCIKCITSSKKKNQRMAEGFRKCLAEYIEYSGRAVPLRYGRMSFHGLVAGAGWSHSLCPLRLYGKNLGARTDKMSRIQ